MLPTDSPNIYSLAGIHLLKTLRHEIFYYFSLIVYRYWRLTIQNLVILAFNIQQKNSVSRPIFSLIFMTAADRLPQDFLLCLADEVKAERPADTADRWEGGPSPLHLPTC